MSLTQCMSEAPCSIDAKPLLIHFPPGDMQQWKLICDRCGSTWWEFQTIRRQLDDLDKRAQQEKTMRE